MILSKSLSLTKFDLKLLNVAGKGREEGRKEGRGIVGKEAM